MRKQPSISDQFIKKLTEITEANLSNEQFGVSELAREMGMSRAALYRKVKLKTKKSVSKFISEIRLEKAVQLFRQHNKNVSEVAYEVGFGSPSYFIKCFHDQFGYSPGELLNGDNEEDLALADSEKNQNKKISSKQKILLILSFSIILVALAFYFFYQNKLKNKPDKTIAVLQFVNESPNESLTILNGLREKIFTNLELIEDIKLVSRATSDKYTGSHNSIKEIGKKLNANYILKGSSVTINGTTRIWLYLIEAETGTTLLSRPYQREITIDNFFEIQAEIATLVAQKLDAIFTSDEKEQIAKIPTQNKAAYRYYLQGLYKQNLYKLDGNKKNYLEAKLLYEKAIVLDSTFADAYCQLADIYITNFGWKYFCTNQELYNLYLDSGMMMVNRAISFGGSSSNKALSLEASYYQKKGMQDKALESFEAFWRNKEKDYTYYLFKSEFYFFEDGFYGAIENFLLYLNFLPDNKLIDRSGLNKFIWYLYLSGFPEIAKIYNEKAYQLHHDSVRYLSTLGYIYGFNGDYASAREIFQKLHLSHNTNTGYVLYTMYSYFDEQNYVEAFKNAQLYEQMRKEQKCEDIPSEIIGYLYRINGKEKKALWHINGALDLYRNQISSNVPCSAYCLSYTHLAMISVMQGDNENAIAQLNLMLDCKKIYARGVILEFKVHPFWDSIREEPEFKKIVNTIKNDYQKEHDRVEKLLMREGLIEL